MSFPWLKSLIAKLEHFLVFETAAPSVIASLSLLTIFKLKYHYRSLLSLQGIWEAYLLASDSAAFSLVGKIM